MTEQLQPLTADELAELGRLEEWDQE